MEDRGESAIEPRVMVGGGKPEVVSVTGNLSRAIATDVLGQAHASGNRSWAVAIMDFGQAIAEGQEGLALTGFEGKAQAGAGGIIAVMYWDDLEGRARLAVGYVGEDGIEPDRMYRFVDGRFFEVAR